MTNPLTTQDIYEEALEHSSKEPVLIFKHSNACPISADADEEVEKLSDTHDYRIYKLVVQDSRDVSDHIAEELGVKHESPQIIILQDGEVIWHGSHYDISAEHLEEHLDNNSMVK